MRNLGLPPDEVENRVRETLRICGIENIQDINPLFLSRGVQGKVAFASVIAMQPKVIVVDEPTTGQDWRSSLEIMNQCKELNENGRTIIAITHDMRLIAEYAKRSIVMVDGQIIFDGPTSEAFVREDVMEKSFIEPPPIIRVFNKIKKRYDIPINITTVDEMTSLLKSWE